MIDTVLFDMDGLLLDTEPLWGESMLRIAEKYNIPVTADKFKETTGLRIYEVTDYWAVKYPWKGATPQDVADEILDDIIELSKEDHNCYIFTDIGSGQLDLIEKYMKNTNTFLLKIIISKTTCTSWSCISIYIIYTTITSS